MLKLIGGIHEVDVGERNTILHFPKLRVVIMGVLSSVCEVLYFGVAIHPMSRYPMVITGICEHPEKPYVLASNQVRVFKSGIDQDTLSVKYTAEEVKYILAGMKAHEVQLSRLYVTYQLSQSTQDN